MQSIFWGPLDLWVADRTIAIYLAFGCVGSSLYFLFNPEDFRYIRPPLSVFVFLRYVLGFGTLVLHSVALGVGDTHGGKTYITHALLTTLYYLFYESRAPHSQ